MARAKSTPKPKFEPDHPDDQQLTPAILEELYAMLEGPVTKQDCGKFCAPKNNGVPVCCDANHAVPLLYQTEFAFLKSRSDLWHEWHPRPDHPDEAELLDDLSPNEIFCDCKGVQFCERENRSLACRTFPFEPYFDKEGGLVGLVFNEEFREKCPLVTTKRSLITQKTINRHFDFWDHFTDIKPSEFETYFENSKTLRRRRGQTKKDFTILYPDHLE